MVFSVGSKKTGPFEVNVDDLIRALLRVDEEEDAQTAVETPGNCDLAAANQRHVAPTHLAGCPCWEIGVEVGGDSKEGRRHVLGMNVVCGYHFPEELTAGCQDVVRSIAIYGDSASDTSAEHAATSSRTRRPFPSRRPCVKRVKHAGLEGIREATTAGVAFRPDTYRRSL